MKENKNSEGREIGRQERETERRSDRKLVITGDEVSREG